MDPVLNSPNSGSADGDGYQIRVPDGSTRAVARIARWSRAVEQALREARVTHVVIDDTWDVASPSLAGLTALAEAIESVELGRVLPPGWEVLYDLPRLSRLSLHGPSGAIDFRRLASVRQIDAHGEHDLAALVCTPHLDTLTLAGARAIDLRPLAEAPPTLRRLALMECRRLRTLDGVGATRVESLSLVRLPKLAQIADVAGAFRLRSFNAMNVSAIEDIGVLESVVALEHIDVEAGPQLPSFHIFSPMRALLTLSLRRVALGEPTPSVAPLALLPSLSRLQLWGVDLHGAADLHRLGESRSLVSLSLGRIGPVASISGWRGFPVLRELELDLRIADGEMSPLLQFSVLEPSARLFAWYPHYSHTLDQVNATLAARRAA